MTQEEAKRVAIIVAGACTVAEFPASVHVTGSLAEWLAMRAFPEFDWSELLSGAREQLRYDANVMKFRPKDLSGD